MSYFWFSVVAVLAIAGAGWFFGPKAFAWLGKKRKQ